MKKKLWIIGLAVTALITLCVGVLFSLNPFSEPTPTEQNNIDALLVEYIHIRDIDEYHNYIAAEKELPEDFVTAEMLSGFGSFALFYADPYDLSGYVYSLIAENGDEIDIYVAHTPSISIKEYEILDISKAGTTMRQLKTDDEGIIVRDGVEYTYVSGGHLISAKWTTNNIHFTIVPDISWSDHSTLPTDSLLYRMMSVSESEFASALTQMNAIPTKNDHVTE